MVDQARLSVGHHGQKKTENEDGESLGDHFSEIVGVGCGVFLYVKPVSTKRGVRSAVKI